MHLRRALVALALAAALPAAAQADPPPPGSTWSQTTITEPDGTKLHADVLRPSNLPADAKTPVIVSVGPYFNHSGQTGPLGPVEGTPYDPTGAAGPSSRFYDFVNGARLMERGYTYVMVDLRGFGGSTGCLDWGGPGEQSDVKAAVQWAAAQPWSTGHVGMYGKSYDGVTGLMGVALRPAGLDAVVSQEPVYDMYRYLYSNRVRFENSFLTPALYTAIDLTPGSIQDDPGYNVNGADNTARPGCYALNYLDQQSDDHSSAYWKARDLISAARGSTVPLFMTQGFIENNTKPDGAYDFFNGVAGPKRAWSGMWDHVRGNDVDSTGRLAMGRHGWFDEVMRFYDQHLRGIAPPVVDPPVAVESSDGSWRSEASWPPADASALSTPLRPGSYSDDAQNNGTAEGGSPNGQGIWTFSPPLAHDGWLAGVPRVTVNAAITLPDANLVADVYDVDSAGRAILISRATYLLGGSGQVAFDLYGDDWKLPAGHRVGVLLTSSNAEWWLHRPTLQPVTVSAASVSLPWRGCSGGAAIEGGPSIKLDSYRADAPFTVAASTISAATDPSFALPPALSACA
jgi:predicted acyl esterase